MSGHLRGPRAVPLLAGALLLALTACGTQDSPSASTSTRASNGSTPVVARPPNDLLRVVSTANPLPADYAPVMVELPREVAAPAAGQLLLVPAAAAAVQSLWEAARAAQLELRILTAFVSYTDQERAAAEASAGGPRLLVQPGTSDRQLGTAVAWVGASAGFALDDRFEASPEGTWLQAHAHEFGFAHADPARDDSAAPPEPWHYRYIGQEEAARWHASGQPIGRYLLVLR